MSRQRTVTVQKREANHTLHIILSICTFGLWIPVWMIATAKGRKTKTVTYAPVQQQFAPQQPYQSQGYQVQQAPYVPQPGQQPYYPQPPVQQYPLQPIAPYRPGTHYPPQ